jgi:hypothetical protein
VTKKFQHGIRDIAIVVAVLALLLALALLFRQPPQPARDLVFGDLGRVHSALTNLTESTSETPMVAPTNNPAEARPVVPLPLTESNGNTALTPVTRPTNNAMADAVAAALAARPLVTTQLAPPPLTPTPMPTPAPAPAPASVPSTPPAPYTPAPGPEPDSKMPTAALLAGVKGDAPAALENVPTSTASLLGVDSDKSTPIPSAATATVAAPTPMPSASTATVVASPQSLPGTGNETNVSFIVDQSLSMRKNGKSSRARRELLQILERMGPAETFYVLVFHSGGDEGMPGLGPVAATPDNIRAMTNWLFSVGHRFGSDPAKGMRRALGIVPAPDTVWLISDGEFSKNAVEAIREANENVNARINTVVLYSAQGRVLMQRIADENGGICRFIAPPP